MSWLNIYDKIQLSKLLGYIDIPVDLDPYGDLYMKQLGKTSFVGDSEEGIIYRDKVMHSEINANVHHDAIFTVGANHLIGLSNKKFTNHHVIFINATDYIQDNLNNYLDDFRDNYSKSAVKFLLLDKSVYQPKKESLLGVECFWHPEKVIQVANKIHDFLTSNMEKSSYQIKMFDKSL